MNKGEIRGLKSAEYWTEEKDCVLSIHMTDRGIHIINADFDTDWAYHWIISPDGKVELFEVESAIMMDGRFDNE